jgi:hypothetical protein
MNFNTKQALIGIFLGITIIFIFGTLAHNFQLQAYSNCLNRNVWTPILTCNKPGWWFGL